MVKRFLACVLLAASLMADEEPPKNLSPDYLAALRKAMSAFNSRDFAAVLKAIDAAEALNPPNALTLNTRGAALIEQKKFKEGAAFCREALEVNPKFYPARFNLCEIPLVQRRFGEARTMFQKLLDENPADELVQYRILLTWLLENNDDAARRVLDAIPFPGDTPAYYYGNAAWEFAHSNQVEAHKWVMRGNWVFRPEVTANFSQPFIEIGWLKVAPGVSATLPELAAQEAPEPAKFELEQPAPAAVVADPANAPPLTPPPFKVTPLLPPPVAPAK